MNEAKAGRPTLTGVKLTRCTVYLTPDQVLGAIVQGSGNVSDGIRSQLAELIELRDWCRTRLAPATSAPAPASR